ncbi:MAG: Ig-like domain repeat protein [Burkholderiaceae bacterium]
MLLGSIALGPTFGASAHDVNGATASQQPSVPAVLNSGPMVQVEGILTVIHTDHFARGVSTQALVIHDGNGHDTPVRFTRVAPELGAHVRISGHLAADGAIDVAESQVEPTLRTLSAMGSQNAIYILVKFLDTASVSFSQADVQATAVTNSNSVANFFQEVSYGKQLLNITVTPWLVAQMNTSATCDYTSVASAANSAATAAGYNLSNYTNKFYVMPFNSSCGWAGAAYVGSPYLAWSNGYNSVQVYTHEMGHNFTLHHAGSLNCGAQTLSAGCSVAEYGDPFDAMGNIAVMHYNAAQKSKLGWLPSSSVIAHNGGSVTYALSPIESAGASTYAVKISAASNRTYWIEYRQPLGFDIGLASFPSGGVQIRVSAPMESTSGSDDTQLLDMTPGSGGGFGDAALMAGQSYFDSTYGIAISVPSVSPTLATVQVSSATLAPTSTALSSSVNPAMVGTPVTFSATVAGKTPIGTVSFSADQSPLCSVALVSGIAQCTSTSLAAGTHGVVASYSGDAVNAPSTSPTLSEIVASVTDTSPPVVTITNPASGSTVRAVVTVSVTATDNVAVAGMTLYVDGAVVATSNTAAISYKWNTNKAAAGTHAISAVAKDTSGNQATATIQVKK